MGFNYNVFYELEKEQEYIKSSVLRKYFENIHDFSDEKIINNDIEHISERAINLFKENNHINFEDKCSFCDSITISLEIVANKEEHYTTVNFTDFIDGIKIDKDGNIVNIYIRGKIGVNFERYDVNDIIKNIVKYGINQAYFMHINKLTQAYNDCFRGIIQTKLYAPYLYPILYPTTEKSMHKLMKPFRGCSFFVTGFLDTTFSILREEGLIDVFERCLLDFEKLKNEENETKKLETINLINKITAKCFTKYDDVMNFIGNRIDVVIYKTLFEAEEKITITTRNSKFISVL